MQLLSKEGLGASEIAAVAGLNPFASPWDVWLAKTGQAEFQGNELTEWGQRLEPAIRQKYADVTGYTVEVPASSMFHPARPWQRATPDGIVFGPSLHARGDDFESVGRAPPRSIAFIEGRIIDRLFQAKNVGEWAGRRGWENGIPDHVQLQEQWEMDVTGAPMADVAALIGGNDWRCATVHYDARIVEGLLTIAGDFLSRLAKGLPPDVDHSEACKNYLTDRMRKADVVEYHADAETEAAIAEWRRLHAEVGKLERARDAVKNRVRKAISDARCEVLVYSDGRLKVQAARTDARINYEAVARLVASAKGMQPDEFEQLVAANTKTSTVGPIISAPPTWKEKS